MRRDHYYSNSYYDDYDYYYYYDYAYDNDDDYYFRKGCRPPDPPELVALHFLGGCRPPDPPHSSKSSNAEVTLKQR